MCFGALRCGTVLSGAARCSPVRCGAYRCPNNATAFLAALHRHFGGPDEKHTAALARDKLRQANRQFGAHYADFQELMDILETTNDASRRHALKRGLNHECGIMEATGIQNWR